MTVESMIAGILEAAVLASAKDEKQREFVSLKIDRDTRTGYVTVIDCVTGIGGDKRKTLADAVESLFLRLAEKAAGEERRASEMLRRLGVPPKAEVAP